MNDLETLQHRKEELQQKLADPQTLRDPQKIKELSIEFSKIEKRLSELSRMMELQKKIEETKEILKSGKDEEILALAREELTMLEKGLKTLEKKQVGEKNLPPDVILEIRAGAGGEEASLFAGELFHMYTQFAKKRGWDILTLDESRSDLGGFKEIIFEINGEDVYKILQFESGVHRVQRIPETEKTGRIHTSTASVAVLPKAREIDVEIKPQDIRVEFFRSSGPGGQNVNKVETAVRMTHIPTGLVIASQESRSQQKNREHALDILRAKLFEVKREAEAKKIGATRREQIGTADRSEKIRTYNFPQDRVTDHRIKESWHNIESIMAGNIENIIEAFNT
ncbi:MAG: Peptide chain release factor 1 [Parcubacteria group bacterium GW2011_GWA2_45_30]|nr:MAG: Peptide chain release factor 1 [Parcubacteria group bacterium GW2011_GWA2_45_30]